MHVDDFTRRVNLGIVCPMANERDTAQLFVREVLAECHKFRFRSVRFFVILDNASTDGTFDIILALSEELPEVSLVFAPENRCVVDAYVRGYGEALEAACDWILEIDAGYSHQPSDIQQFFETMMQGYDCVFGSRFCGNGRFADSPKTRYLISRCGTILTNLLLGTELHDMTSGFELFTRETLREILGKGIISRGPFFQTEIRVYAHEFRIAEVPIHYRVTSKHINARVLFDAFSNLWRLLRLRISRSF